MTAKHPLDSHAHALCLRRIRIGDTCLGGALRATTKLANFFELLVVRKHQMCRCTNLEVLCRYCDPERFYSYRRSTHRGEADYGRQLSAIALG